MKRILVLILGILIFQACEEPQEVSSINPVNWERRTVNQALGDSLSRGETYLSVYSSIYSFTEHRTHELTATVSMRNTNRSDSIYIDKAEYFNTKGESIRVYFNKTIFIRPMETVEIVIDEIDKEGGTGANFLFEWRVPTGAHEPLFEGVMISTSGQQGLSFTTQGKRVE